MSNPMRVKETLWTRQFSLLILATTLVCLVVNMYNLGMTYYADLLQGSIAYSGISSGVFSFAALIFRPFAGILSNRFNRRKLLISSTVLFAAITYSHGFVDSISELVVARVIHGVLFSAFSTCSGAEVNSILPRSRLSEGLGFYSVSIALTPAIGPLLYTSIVHEGDIVSFGPLFLLSTLLCFIGLLVIILMRTAGSVSSIETKDPQALIKPVSDNLPKTILGFEPATLLPAFYLCLLAFSFSSVNFFLPQFAYFKGFGNIGLFYLIFAIASVSIRPFVGRLADNHSPNGLLYAGMICLCVCYALIPFCTSEVVLFTLAIPFGLGMGMAVPLLNSYIVRRGSVERPGSASAAFFAAYDLGYSLGSPIVGLTISAFNFTAVYFSCAVISFIGVVLFHYSLARRANQVSQKSKG